MTRLSQLDSKPSNTAPIFFAVIGGLLLLIALMVSIGYIVKLKSDVDELKLNVSLNNREIASLSSNAGILKGDILNLKSDVHNLKGDIASIRTTLNNFIDKYNSLINRLR